MSLVACYRNTSGGCDFHHIQGDSELEYDIWLVNGNPNASSYNPLVYQFSFDRQASLRTSAILDLYFRKLDVYLQNKFTSYWK